MTSPQLLCQNILFDWAESLDTKNWDKLDSLFTRSITVDYGGVVGFENVSTPKGFIESLAHPASLGKDAISTQHFVGATKWEEVSEKKWVVTYQIRVAHWHSKQGADVRNANGYGLNTMEFELTEEGWKIVHLKVRPRMMEGDIAAVLSGH
ncbi:NTF2-like protein [Penicillium herquei]|nr:NTF2-like protein [Penicillium herquei]